MHVPFFEYSKLYAHHAGEYREAIDDVLSRGAFILQSDIDDFESRLAAYLGVQAAIGVGNCTDGLSIALRAVGIGPGDEVIAPSHTFVATIATIVSAGATPVLVDCGDDHLIDPAAAEAAISPRTSAIIPVSLNGRAAELPRIVDVADRHGLVVIEDAAQALGASVEGVFAGTAGKAGAFSFYPAKTLGAFGDAGAIVTSDPDVARYARIYHDHGRNHDSGQVEMWGINSRLDNLQAAILNVQLTNYESNVQRRREVAAMYQAGLGHLAQLRLPPAPSDGRHYDIFQNYEIEAVDRDALQASLKADDIGTIVQWGGSAVHQFAGLKLDFDLPYTEALFGRMLLLPMNQLLTNEQVEHVVDSVCRHYASTS